MRIIEQKMYVGRWRSDNGNFTAIVQRGRTKLHLVTVGYPIAVSTLDLKDERYVDPLPYPPNRAARQMLRLGKSNGITKSAKTLLKVAAGQP